MSGYEERAREWLEEHGVARLSTLTSLAALLREVAEEARQATLAEMDLLSQSPEFNGKNWADAVHRYAVAARTPHTPYDRGKEAGQREGWRRGCEACERDCQKEYEGAEEYGNDPVNLGSVSRNHISGMLRTAEDCRRACRRLADNYEEPSDG